MSENAGSDGIEEALAQNLRGLTQAAHTAGRAFSNVIDMVRRRQMAARERAEVQERYQRAWEGAQERLSVTRDPEWWDRASPKEIAEVYEVAVTWREHEPEAQRYDDLIHHEVLERYDHDLRTPSREQVQSDLEHVEAERQEEQASEQDQEKEEVLEQEGEGPTDPEAVLTPGETEQEQSEAQQEQAGESESPAYDSEEHRTQVAEQRTRDGVEPELVETHERVERMNANEPRNAVDLAQSQKRLRGAAGLRGRSKRGELAMS